MEPASMNYMSAVTALAINIKKINPQDPIANILLLTNNVDTISATYRLFLARQRALYIAATTEQALREAAEREYYLVVLDVDQYDADSKHARGIELINRVRQHENTKDAVLIGLTKHGLMHVESAAFFNHGMRKILKLPIQLSTLETIFATLVFPDSELNDPVANELDKQYKNINSNPRPSRLLSTGSPHSR